MFNRHKKLFIGLIVAVILIGIFFPLKNIFSANNSRNYDTPSLLSYEGIVAYTQDLIKKYPRYDRFFALYIPYIFLNLVKVAIFLVFALMMVRFISRNRTPAEPTFTINWTLRDIVRVYILALVVHSSSLFIWEDVLSDNIPLWIVIEATFQSIILGFFIVAKVLYIKGDRLDAIGLFKFPLKDFLALVLKTAIIMTLISGVLSFLLDYEIMPSGRWIQLFQGTRVIQRGPFVFLQFLLLMFIAPVCEEMFFRGFLYSFLRNALGFKSAAVAVSLLFAVLHLNMISFAVLFTLSMFLCVIYERTHNLTYPIIVHAFYNIFLTTGFIIDLVK